MCCAENLYIKQNLINCIYSEIFDAVGVDALLGISMRVFYIFVEKTDTFLFQTDYFLPF